MDELCSDPSKPQEETTQLSLSALRFEPGNAYNAEVINQTKQSGQKVLIDSRDIKERKIRINQKVLLKKNNFLR